MTEKPVVLVTGGAGYIGSHCVLALQSAGFPVVVLDNLVYGHREFVEGLEAVTCVWGDISDRALVDQVLSQFQVGAVMHFAAYAYVGESVGNPAKYYRNNVVGTLTLLEAMLAAQVPYLVFSSTCATYGIPQQVPISEDHPQHPINPYGMSKLMVEQMLTDFDQAYGLRSVRFRYFNAAGADPLGRVGEDHQPETHLIPLVLLTALGQREDITIFGTDYDTPDGTCIRDYIHVTDLAEAHVLGLNYLLDGGSTNVFNLGNGDGFSVRQIIQAAQEVTQRSINVQFGSRRPGDPAALIGQAQRAQKVLQWKPKYPEIDTILDHAWRWHLQRHRPKDEAQG
ncbi:UDP-glucose 4-epimerase GalE [Lyngbya confervoides]|uniref:UDP-glucose 4-epimerase n=1 Tax=Lyngbya confervoides BDU141951 TaxID=1574623 RepID=A0ABD4T187_9CYAN|nr:UDP-glucose 4-epimerase GalE [Lyngbya confervoides]MCM1982472.1 UDP-glucose 4-epimerase GalE [Lyngbya confervoides BDU141951]